MPILDSDKKELQELRKELARMKAALPKLGLSFSQTKNNRLELVLYKSTETDDNHEQIINDIFNKLKYTDNYNLAESIKLPKKKLKDLSETELAGCMQYMKSISKEEIIRYERELEDYLKEYRCFLEEKVEYDKFKDLTFKLELIIVNDGNSPANDIDIFIHLPDGFTVYSDESLPAAPTERNRQ